MKRRPTWMMGLGLVYFLAFFAFYFYFLGLVKERSILGELSDTSSTSTSSSSNTLGSTTTTTRPYDGRPRVLFTRGCSGSSATTRMIAKIVTSHYGVESYKARQELYTISKNPMYERAKAMLGPTAEQSRILEKSFELLHQDAVQQNQILFTKLPPNMPQLKRYLQTKLNATFSTEIRTNAVDRYICEVRDCMGGALHSYPVFAHNGSRTDLCFARRRLPDLKIMAYMDPNDFPKRVRELHKDAQITYRTVEKEFPGHHVQSYEDLFAFGQSSEESVFQASLQAWIKLVEPYIEGGVDVALVEEILRPSQGTRPPNAPHRELIYNYDEASAVLHEREPQLAKDMLRE